MEYAADEHAGGRTSPLKLFGFFVRKQMRFAQQAGRSKNIIARPTHTCAAPGGGTIPDDGAVVQVQRAEGIDTAGENRDIQGMFAFREKAEVGL